MMLTRWYPPSRLSRNRPLGHELDRFFDDFFSFQPFGWTGDADSLLPAVADVVETEDGYRISIELPGVDKDGFKLTVRDNTLHVTAEKRCEDEVADESFRRRERIYGAYSRRFSFGEPIHAGKVSASYRNGVLEISVPKAEEAKARAVEVKVS